METSCTGRSDPSVCQLHDQRSSVKFNCCIWQKLALFQSTTVTRAPGGHHNYSKLNDLQYHKINGNRESLLITDRLLSCRHISYEASSINHLGKKKKKLLMDK
uniref:Uncharacterized protein n=1 Tax=Oryza glaberrima TaxID=4538 RepID=I1NY34_ORYGL